MRVVGFRDLDLVDYIVIQDDRAVGRIYEDRQTLPDLRWFWSITVYVNPKRDINTSGRAASLEGAKANSYRTGRSAAPARLPRVNALPSSELLGSFLRSRDRLRQPHAVDPGTLPEVGIGYGCSPRFYLPWTAGVCDTERIGPSTEGRVRLSE